MIKIKTFYRLPLAIILFTSCYTKDSSKSTSSLSIENSGNSKPIRSKVEIYCWCFLNKQTKKEDNGNMTNYVTSCRTWSSIKPAELIKPEYLLDSITNNTTISELQHLLINSGKSNSSTIAKSVDIDSRFLILFKSGDLGTDTVVCNQNLTFIHNGELLNFTFNVMDSIRKILNKEKIDCPGK